MFYIYIAFQFVNTPNKVIELLYEDDKLTGKELKHDIEQPSKGNDTYEGVILTEPTYQKINRIISKK